MQDLTTTFAGYHLHEVLSVDAASTLYRATARGRDAGRGGRERSVALLVSDVLDSDGDRGQAQVFQRKARAAMDVNHAGIARVLDTGSAAGRVYMATAWRDSIPLDEVITVHWLRTPDEAIELLEQVARGLDAAHEAGLVHGALGPRTIRVDADETTGRRSAYVSGFGLDALLSGQLGSRRSRDAAPALDDLLYVAPEQVRGGLTGPATDQYALACVLYHCVTGQPPFVRDTATALFGAHLFARPPVTGVLATDGNRDLRSALATGMSKRPDDRHASCTRLLIAAREGPSDTHIDLGAGVSTGRPTVGGRPPRTTARVVAVDSTRTPLLHRITTVVRSGLTSARPRPEQLPGPVMALVALLAGMLLALLLVVLLRDAGPSPTTSDDHGVTAVLAASVGPDRSDTAS